ncbi:MAG: hypothetical protein LBV18_03865 [Alistipes sp.]|nr:hypothetical protein [Alistipes sp.]
MKNVLFAMVACLAMVGCKDKEFDLPEPLSELEYTKWVSSSLTEDDAILLLGETDANFWTDNEILPNTEYHGEGIITSIDKPTILFSDFVATTMYDLSAIKIEKAEYSFKNEYLHILTVFYREDTNPPFNPLDPPEWTWSEIKTREFMLYNEKIHGNVDVRGNLLK